MRHLPKFTYSGLTIVLSNGSRFDARELLSATAGHWFNEVCLRPEMNRYQCDIRTCDDTSPLLPNTRCILLLGQRAMQTWSQTGDTYTIGEQRGSLLIHPATGIPMISSYLPQDACDMQDYEGRLNPTLAAQETDEYEGESNDKRRHGATSRSNWRFWLSKDAKKAIRIVRQGVPKHDEPEFKVYPSSTDIITELRNTKGQHLYFDIETDSDYNILCFAYCFDTGPVSVVPLIRYDYTMAYGLQDSIRILQALAIAIRDNTLVAHNGYSFDFFILAYKYRIAINKAYDTLIAQHRCYPEVEKSLGHCVSLWTYEPYHKDEGVFMPQNPHDERKLWVYCAKDVATMRQIKRAIDLHASVIPGLTDSIAQAMSCIKPYLITTLTGIKFDAAKRDAVIAANDRDMTQLLRPIKALVGHDVLPTSNKSMTEYFHDELGYKVVKRTKATKKFPSGNRSLAKDALYKLKILYPGNPVIDLALKFRKLKHDSGMLQFNPMWSRLGELPNPEEVPTSNRVTCLYKIPGTETYRLSSTKVLDHFGTNLQNQEKNLGVIYVPDDGKVFVQVDQSGAEALIVSYLCKHGNFRDLFLHNIKPHVYVALHVFANIWQERLPALDVNKFVQSRISDLKNLEGWSELKDLIAESDNWPSAERYYYIGKMLCHASNYGMRASAFQLNVLDKSKGTIYLPRIECERLLGVYHNLFPEIQQWHVEVQTELRNTGVIRNLQGYPRVFCGLLTAEETWKEAYAFNPQSTVGTITNIAYAKLQAYIEATGKDWDLVSNKHDSYMVQCPFSEKEHAAHMMLQYICQTFTTPRGETFTMKAEAQWGYNWSPQHEKKNPDGLRKLILN